MTLDKLNLVGIDGNTDFEWTIYSLPMEEDYIASLKYDPNDARVIQGNISQRFILILGKYLLFQLRHFINSIWKYRRLVYLTHL